jgi:hypothetical protein
LRNSQVKSVNLERLDIDPIRLDNGKIMPLHLKVLAEGITRVDNPEEIRLARLDRKLGIATAVDQSRVRQRFRTATDKSFEQIWRLFVVPVTQCHEQLSPVDLVLVRGLLGFDDHGPAEAVEDLGFVVGVPPVCSYLVDLSSNQPDIPDEGNGGLTVKS